MPGMGGVEAARAIRAQERGSGVHTPILAVTAHARTDDRDECLAAGMDGYIAKPLRVDELLSAIASLAARGRSIDPRRLLADFGHNRRLLDEVVATYLTDAPSQIATLRAAVEKGDAAAAASAAHTIKGSAGLFSTGAAYEAARRVEQAARAGDGADLSRRSEQLIEALGRLVTELETVRTELASKEGSDGEPGPAAGGTQAGAATDAPR
jgi:DNA-binding response OmpR family regulator